MIGWTLGGRVHWKSSHLEEERGGQISLRGPSIGE